MQPNILLNEYSSGATNDFLITFFFFLSFKEDFILYKEFENSKSWSAKICLTDHVVKGNK